MKRVGSIKEVVDIALELPAGAVPYEEFDFEPYFEEAQNEEELRKTWRVFTKVKDVLENGRRLENASWRLWHRERNKTGVAPTDVDALTTASVADKYDLTQSLQQAEKETDRIVGDMFGGVGQRFQEENEKVVQRARAERTRALLELAKKHDLTDDVVNDVLSWVASSVISAEEVVVHQAATLLPETAHDARSYLHSTVFMPRPRVAAFCHSLERNGANNFLLYLLRELREQLSFEVFSPKEGAMRADYEAMGIPVSICDMKLVTYPEDVRAVLKKFQYAIANTIMTTEVINACRDLSVPCLWVIHEAWPKEHFNYYAKEVFMMTHLDEKAIVDAFSNASKIVFPAQVQRRCYNGLFEEQNARVIYNGIPLASINAFRAVQNRDAVRKELGYGPDDFLLVHMGTVCKRKAQLVTCQSFAELYANGPLANGKSFKLLMVGARYIRQHEIEYIEECKHTLEAVGAEEAATILDVKKNVLPYYLAADIILCPSINEVLPLVICEGMAFERAVIATRIDGIPEALSHGVEGLLIEPNNPMALYDAIEKLANDDELRSQMGMAGRKRVLSQFSFATMSKTYRETISLDLEIVANGEVISVQG
ncbi:D-inositol 3-phosphate glycosyltransferase [Gracilariopsis chorda]|uniref:D-inositol 3-phosphate glycosyltransferase n=1 Tax=Gracilariopsis chorda TaxID=448386 RepID=A0A2V3J092_9FLOR|nr:D-inositol 3-phosphate glycosyltransferase [Gracilariopsis chorda]|eukprot:PXF47723.1 D-inositol 3-phosphate glycosyltransferase [Gracilariopsis chorda]